MLVHEINEVPTSIVSEILEYAQRNVNLQALCHNYAVEQCRAADHQIIWSSEEEGIGNTEDALYWSNYARYQGMVLSIVTTQLI